VVTTPVLTGFTATRVRQQEHASTVDAAAVPPAAYNHDDKQRVVAVTIGTTGQVTPQW
jgi:hypothetical protein